MGVLQWNSLVALNYTAKSLGVNRHMKYWEALEVCPQMMFVHVATIIKKVEDSKSDQNKKFVEQTEDDYINQIID